MTTVAASFTHTGTPCIACIKCSSKATEPFQKRSPASGSINQPWKTKPANTAPSDSTISGTSIVTGLSCG